MNSINILRYWKYTLLLLSIPMISFLILVFVQYPDLFQFELFEDGTNFSLLRLTSNISCFEQTKIIPLPLRSLCLMALHGLAILYIGWIFIYAFSSYFKLRDQIALWWDLAFEFIAILFIFIFVMLPTNFVLLIVSVFGFLLILALFFLYSYVALKN